jgi:hypothetical protein
MKEFCPKDSKCAEGPSRARVSKGTNLLVPHKVVLFLSPFVGEVTVKEMSPTNKCLFLNKLVISTRESSWINLGAFEPTIESRDQYVE